VLVLDQLFRTSIAQQTCATAQHPSSHGPLRQAQFSHWAPLLSPSRRLLMGMLCLRRFHEGRAFEYLWHVIFGEPPVIKAVPHCSLYICKQ
jgi:hypothetical protein